MYQFYIRPNKVIAFIICFQIILYYQIQHLNSREFERNLTFKVEMKPKNEKSKALYKDMKKRRQKNSNNSLGASSQINDDSLDEIINSQKTKARLNTNTHEQINEQDLKQLRTCISNQFKKSNFINFSAIKNDSSRNYVQSDYKNNQKHYLPNYTGTKQQTKISQLHVNKKMFTSHNRSQSCPFIQPLYIYDNLAVKDAKNDFNNIVSSCIKIDKQPKKKISIQHLNKNRNKFNVGGSAQKKNISHNYSNSLTQSSNTMIIHNIPNEISNNIAPNQNLSSILYKKVEQQPEEQTRKYKIKEENLQVMINGTVQQNRTSQLTQKAQHKKSLRQTVLKQDFLIRTRIGQRIKRYQVREQLDQIKKDSTRLKIKQQIVQKLLKLYEKQQQIQMGLDMSKPQEYYTNLDKNKGYSNKSIEKTINSMSLQNKSLTKEKHTKYYPIKYYANVFQPYDLEQDSDQQYQN